MESALTCVKPVTRLKANIHVSNAMTIPEEPPPQVKYLNSYAGLLYATGDASGQGFGAYEESNKTGR